jgi:hypothetical protein
MGIGSESLHELANAMDVPKTIRGDSDRMVTQRGWANSRNATPNVILREMPRADHFP